MDAGSALPRRLLRKVASNACRLAHPARGHRERDHDTRTESPTSCPPSAVDRLIQGPLW